MDAAEIMQINATQPNPNLRAVIQSPLFQFSSSLYSVRNRSQKRKVFSQEPMLSTDHYTVKMSGEQLDQHDLAVLLSAILVGSADNSEQSGILVVGLQQILRGLNTTDGSSQRRAINNSFQRFVDVNFEVSFAEQVFNTPILKSFDYSTKSKSYTLVFSEQYSALSVADTSVAINVKERNSLPQGLTSWLYGYWTNFDQIPPLQIEELYKLCGSSSSSMSTFKRSLTMALSTLENIGFIQPNWNISKPGFIFANKTTPVVSQPISEIIPEEIFV